MHRAIFIILFFLAPMLCWSQFLDLQFIIANKNTKIPVADAHIFISNASFGCTSDHYGLAKLSIPNGVKEDLVISHVSYDTKVLNYIKFRNIADGDSIFLTPNGINIDEIVVTQKRSKTWKKYYKRFSEAFLGDGKIASKCKILNPEVLRFNDNNDNFSATAIDILQIQNDHLAYKIEFLLENLTIDKNGSMKYIGHANFIDIASKKDQKEINKNRHNIYLRSPKHFLEHLIKNDLEGGKYKIRLVKYINGNFEELFVPQVEDILYYDSISNHYLLSFKEFLEIKHVGFKEYDEISIGVRSGGLESSRFNTRTQGATAKVTYPVSLLYKLTPNLILNQYGDIINHRAVQEYGYWAKQRMAQKLPLDYGIDYSTYKEFGKDGIIEKPESDSQTLGQRENSSNKKSSLDVIKDLLYGDKSIKEQTFNYLNDNWNNSYLPPLLDLLRINQDPYIQKRINTILKDKIGLSSYYDGLQWLWENDPVYDTIYGNVKAEIYQHIDPKFQRYFANRDTTAVIGLDEIVWGGVKQDGIPPLRYPTMIKASDAAFLSDSDIVFGISIEGIHRAYPKRILAWHEFFVDTISGKKIAGVYCTLCGTMIAYNMHHNDKYHDLGTSGFLYRSNKLMYDKETQSLWSTIEGKPVLGPLIDQGIELKSYSTITTTWGEWKKMHPISEVLALNTGYNRNYNEGEAYRDYFATDNLMFPVPLTDNRLNNKDEVMVIRSEDYLNDPFAISINYLKKVKIFQGQIAGEQFVVIAENKGGTRAYNAGNHIFKSYKNGILKDDAGNIWKITESFIIGPMNQKLSRIPSHNSFWFAWINAYPNTRLIK